MQSKSNALWVIPIIIDGAEESACDVVRCTSICLGCSRKGRDRRWDAVVQPISNGFLQDSCIMATSIFCSMLKLRQRRHQRSPKICWQRAYRSQAGVKIFGIVDLLLEPWNERVQELNSDIAPFTTVTRRCHKIVTKVKSTHSLCSSSISSSVSPRKSIALISSNSAGSKLVSAACLSALPRRSDRL